MTASYRSPAPQLAPDSRRCLTRTQLTRVSRHFADEVAAGRYAYELDAEQRWHRRIYRDQQVDVWLISWLPEQGTQLHDHGGSSGSFAVLLGELTESCVSGTGELTNRRHSSGACVGFGSHYVHDVYNTSSTAAVSVHAYSAPLTTMTYYDLADGVLIPTASLATDDPEPDFDPVAARRAS